MRSCVRKLLFVRASLNTARILASRRRLTFHATWPAFASPDLTKFGNPAQRQDPFLCSSPRAGASASYIFLPLLLAELFYYPASTIVIWHLLFYYFQLISTVLLLASLLFLVISLIVITWHHHWHYYYHDGIMMIEFELCGQLKWQYDIMARG